jgi:hypothetical protein
MVVMEWIETANSANKGGIGYDFVEQRDNEDDLQHPPHDNMALQFLQSQEDEVHQRNLEVDYLTALRQTAK